jgi:RNA polymerase sigma-70 factor (ECF subfamily)
MSSHLAEFGGATLRRITGRDTGTASLETVELFNAAWAKDHAAVFRYVVSRVGLREAEDITSETYLAAFRARASYRDERSQDGPRAWFLGVATRQIGKHRKAERRWLDRAALSAPDGIERGPEETLMDDIVAPGLAAALRDLPAPQRDALLLNVLAELDYGDVAAALNLPLGTVRSRIHRAKASVQAQLQRRDPS